MSVKNLISDHIETAKNLNEKDITKLADLIIASYKKGGKLLIAGNGGSAADAQHFAAELVGRFIKERKGLPAIALTTNSSNVTAIGNDYGFEHVFERQVEALGKKEDVLVVISTSGNSKNLIKAVEKAKLQGLTTIALLGKEGGKLKGMCNHELIVPSSDTQRIQEMHMLIIHLVCGLIEDSLQSKIFKIQSSTL